MNNVKKYGSALGIRGDMIYCPLAFYIDAYWTCEPECEYCYARRLNRTWGNDFRVADVEEVKKKLTSTKKGNSPLRKAIEQHKTIRMGNRADPFQNCEEEYKASTEIVKFLVQQDWDMVIQTKYPTRAYEMTGLGDCVTLLAEISVGLEQDWELFEHKLTENPMDRIKILKKVSKKGYRVGVNGEPFIPGYHTVDQFKDTIKLLKSNGITHYNIYNAHLNDWVIKNFFELGLDIEKIWYMNQDVAWRKIQKQLIQIAKEEDIILGCPDFVNSGWSNVQKCNTCCGIDVKNPCTFNTHHFKLAIQHNQDPLECWDEVGDYEMGVSVIKGTISEMYTIKDIRP